MTYIEFKNKYNGKFVDYDGAYGSQCWDLAEKYFIEVLGLPASVLAGCGLVSNMLYPPKRKVLDKYFDEIPTDKMQQGDVCIWEYGHIAIFDHYSGNYKYYFSQNPNPAEVIRITASGLHSFRKKGTTPQPTTKYKIGDVVTIDGVYISSDSTKKLTPAITSGTITKILEGRRNPYLLNNGGIGWVNNDCITGIVTNDFKVGDNVVTISTGNGSSQGTSNVAKSGIRGTITRIIPNAKYPYLVSKNNVPMGWYKKESLKLI